MSDRISKISSQKLSHRAAELMHSGTGKSKKIGSNSPFCDDQIETGSIVGPAEYVHNLEDMTKQPDSAQMLKS